MSLSAAYKVLDEPERPFPSCKTCTWYAKLNPDDKEFFDRMAEEPDANLTKLMKACKASGDLDVVSSSFRNHVREHHRLVRGL